MGVRHVSACVGAEAPRNGRAIQQYIVKCSQVPLYHCARIRWVRRPHVYTFGMRIINWAFHNCFSSMAKSSDHHRQATHQFIVVISKLSGIVLYFKQCGPIGNTATVAKFRPILDVCEMVHAKWKEQQFSILPKSRSPFFFGWLLFAAEKIRNDFFFFIVSFVCFVHVLIALAICWYPFISKGTWKWMAVFFRFSRPH